MRLRDAVEMLAGSGVERLGPTTWADLGCGTGTFTLALAELLAPDSVIHAIDEDDSALRQIPSSHKSARIRTHRGDFLSPTWPFENVDGILMANSLHYVRDQVQFIRECNKRMTSPGRFLVIEYDTHDASPWVPYPVPQAQLKQLFADAGYTIQPLRSRPSVFRRAALYSALAVSGSA